MIKSSVRIVDSDSDDDDDDEAFFARERELRIRMAQRAEAGKLPSSGTKKVGKKTGKNKPPETSKKDVWVVDSLKEGSVVSDVVTIDTENDENVDLGINGNDSESGDIEAVRPAKKRKVRRALSISSDGE